MDSFVKKTLTAAIISLLLAAAFWIGIAYVAWHFISKFW